MEIAIYCQCGMELTASFEAEAGRIVAYPCYQCIGKNDAILKKLRAIFKEEDSRQEKRHE